MWLGNVQIAKPKLTAKAMRFGVARIRQYVVKLAAIAAAMGVADMNGGPSQKARVLIAVSRSAKVHAEQRRAAMSPEERERRQQQWDDPLFDGGLYWKQVWNEGNLK